MKPSPLKIERELRGWPQSKIAKALKVSIRTVSRWEQGETMPQLYYREQLSALFGKTIQELGLLSDIEESTAEGTMILETSLRRVKTANEQSDAKPLESDRLIGYPSPQTSSNHIRAQGKVLAVQQRSVSSLIEDVQADEWDTHSLGDQPFPHRSLLGICIPHQTSVSITRSFRRFASHSPSRISLAILAIIIILMIFNALQPVQVSLTGSYTEQTGDSYDLTAEGTLDWIHWGLNGPRDMNHKNLVQQQISNFTLIGNGVVQRDTQYTNAYTWADGTPVDSSGDQQSGVYVRGVGNGFTFNVLASATPRTLRVYVGAAHAKAKFWAGIGGKTFTDTSLDMRDDPNIEDNNIYRLVFSSNAANSQVLTVKYTVLASDASNGYVMLEAATLQ